jgi:uncharacterized membrane protein YedE/YeeE
MHDFSLLQALIGGLLIGIAASLMLLLKGRIAGISGIVGGLLQPTRGDMSWRGLFLIGMISAPLFVGLFTGQLPAIATTASDRTLIIAGLLVGFGTRLGSGCTSGHGVCGLGRRSLRSLVATLIFMATAALTVLISRHYFSAEGTP